MPDAPRFEFFAGHWKGTNHLWLEPGVPARESVSELVITMVAQDLFYSFAYTWADKGKPQDGLLIVGQEKQSGIVRAAWIDSWHMQDKFMICEGKGTSEGGFSVRGTYAAPPDPDWGWRITIEPGSNETLRLTMHNITPQGEEMLAVETVYVPHV